VDALAGHLGIGARHLRRLFLKHLGASPLQVAQTRRLHFVKKLLDETTLPMYQVAVAGGFGSVRRFNAAIRRTYKRTPTQVRTLSRRSGPEPENEYFFRLRFRRPFDWSALLEFLSARATPGVEVVEGGRYRRTISFAGRHGTLEASLDETGEAIGLRIRIADPRWLFHVVERARAMFDLNADPEEIDRALCADPFLAERVARRPGLRVPGCWDGFELALRAVLGQQVTVKGATTLAGRLAHAFGQALNLGHGLSRLAPLPEALAAAGAERIMRIGLPRARAATIHALAAAVAEGRLSFSRAADLNGFLARFRALPGIGDWTAQYVAMRAFGDPDAFPASDQGVLRAAGARSAAGIEKRSLAWRPYRAYAAMYLWQAGGGERMKPRRRAAD
jgi:AraC family transcriptional regulator of adaptative response / DNA-3-methyladenine glycosylase II